MLGKAERVAQWLSVALLFELHADLVHPRALVLCNLLSKVVTVLVAAVALQPRALEKPATVLPPQLVVVPVAANADVAPIAQHHQPFAVSRELLGLCELHPLLCQRLALPFDLLDEGACRLLLLAPNRRKFHTHLRAQAADLRLQSLGERA